MTEKGSNLLQLIQEARIYCKNLGNLLGTCDNLMAEMGWKGDYSNQAIFEASNNLNYPAFWIPNEVFRFYKSDRHPQLLCFVSVLMDDREKEYSNFLLEPAITAGWFDYGKNKEPENNWEFWYSRFHGYNSSPLNYEGTLFKENPNLWEDGEKYPFEWACTFGLPLVSVTNAEELKQKIVEPLIKNLTQFS